MWPEVTASNSLWPRTHVCLCRGLSLAARLPGGEGAWWVARDSPGVALVSCLSTRVWVPCPNHAGCPRRSAPERRGPRCHAVTLPCVPIVGFSHGSCLREAASRSGRVGQWCSGAVARGSAAWMEGQTANPGTAAASAWWPPCGAAADATLGLTGQTGPAVLWLGQSWAETPGSRAAASALPAPQPA